ncbi:MAG: TolC family protein [Bacteroidales bacterium]|nr:TolC family protein [Candidatus Physcousia equi]
MKKIFTLIASALLAAPLMAQDVLTIDQCRSLALQNNKERKSAALVTQRQDLTVKSTRALFLPDFSITGFGLYDTGDGTLGLGLTGLKQQLTSAVMGGMQAGVLSPGMAQWLGGVGEQVPDQLGLDYKIGFVYGASLVMKQPLYMGGKIRAGYAMAQTAAQMARQNERLTDAEVIQQADEAYANCVKATELKKVAEQYKVLLEELNRNVQSAIKHGMKMPADQMKVQVKLNEVELQIRRAENAQRLAAMNLCHVTGQPLKSSFAVNSDYPAVDDARLLAASDITSRPEYALLEGQAQLAAQQVRMTRSEMLPQVTLLAKYGYAHGLEFNDKNLLDGWNFAAGITLNVPLYHFGERSNKLKAARLKQQQAELERDNKSELMQLELARAANNLDEARLEVELAERTLAQSRESMRLSEQQYKAGTEPLSDFLESQAVWQKAYESQVEAHFQLYLQSVAYLKAAGRLVE